MFSLIGGLRCMRLLGLRGGHICPFLESGVVVLVGCRFLGFTNTIIKQCFKALRPCRGSHCT